MPRLQSEIRQDAAPPPYTASFGVGSPDDPRDTMELNSFSERRKVRVTITENLTATHKENGGARTTTPSGYLGGDCTGRVYVIFAGNQGSYMPACSSTGPFTKEFVAQGQGRAFRDGYGSTAGWRCDAPKQDQFCWNFSGTQQVTVEVIDYPGRMTAYDGSTEKTTIPAAKSLWFAWTPMPNQSDIPKATYNWWFVTADSGRVIQNAVPYGYEAQWGYVPKSGTMYVKVTINGVEKTLSRYIHVGAPTLTMTADQQEIWDGDSVVFTAKVRPDTTMTSGYSWWWFRQATQTMALRSAEPARGLNDPRTRRAGVGAKGTPAITLAGDSVQVCSGQTTRCALAPRESGEMRVHATVGGQPKHATVPVVVKQDELTVVAAPTNVQTSEYVTFTATALSGRPVVVMHWTWHAGPRSVTSTSHCGTPPTCTVQVFESGTMVVTAVVGIALRTVEDSASVTATPCEPTGDPMLDSPAVRRGLKQMLYNGDPYNPDSWNRREDQLWIFRRPDGSHYGKFPNPADYLKYTPCEVLTRAPLPDDPLDLRVALAHGHAAVPGETIYCAPPVPGQTPDTRTYDPRGGFHFDDLRWHDTQTHSGPDSNPVPNDAYQKDGIIMDPIHAYKAEIQNGKAQQTVKHKWNSLSCEW